MEITVRTAEEIAADRVTIEVNGARLYTAAEVGDAQASEAELVAEPLRRRIEELTQSVDARDRLLRTASEEASEARRRVIELTAELEEQRQRADANQAWAERAEGRVAAYGLDLAATRRELDEARSEGLSEAHAEFLAAALGKVAGAVAGPHVLRALRNPWTIWTETEAVALAGAVRDVRRIIGSPELGS
jgi:chromosome segregation ATPase